MIGHISVSIIDIPFFVSTLAHPFFDIEEMLSNDDTYRALDTIGTQMKMMPHIWKR